MKVLRTFIALAVMVAFIGGCGALIKKQGKSQSNPAFFEDTPPEKGPWEVDQSLEDKFYAKVYTHHTLPVIIISSFVITEELYQIDLTDRRNQQLLAEKSLMGLCEGLDFQCQVQSSDVAWIVGNPVKYIYVRFKADSEDSPTLQGLVYYRADPPIQTMHLLMADEKHFADYEEVFLDYMSTVKFNPDYKSG